MGNLGDCSVLRILWYIIFTYLRASSAGSGLLGCFCLCFCFCGTALFMGGSSQRLPTRAVWTSLAVPLLAARRVGCNLAQRRRHARRVHLWLQALEGKVSSSPFETIIGQKKYPPPSRSFFCPIMPNLFLTS